MGYANTIDESPVTVTKLQQMKQLGEKFSVLTAYDSTFAQLIDQSGIAAILVGDSLGMVVQGNKTTVLTTPEEMAYHSRLVSRGCDRALLIADLPFLSYATPELALKNATLLMQEGRAQVVKLEGGQQHLESIRLLAANGVPVCGHLGLLPQSVNKLGGYKVQGRQSEAADRMMEEALALQEAGADMLVTECIPSELGARLSRSLNIPVIGIGAGPDCDAQVLVLYDMLGITRGHTPKFAHNFLAENKGVLEAMIAFDRAVKNGHFPAPEHCY
ncbi:3-methyl-2-oxobutanoate hydroxymethyltransferase [Sedimenticola hydrogenitrophicus]|uniref:3-methyl-2-oxobutanoate hydroxymethyltransferase n=1 Tax=Sedimenticola hydrogenitrophicus TaxID=2967975 RepID=UPI0023AE9258|nr:3-methyl-2-oxobutanoate hydroxymethyltransferase [Sedimenticola hydrogenitrophicus]